MELHRFGKLYHAYRVYIAHLNRADDPPQDTGRRILATDVEDAIRQCAALPCDPLHYLYPELD